MVFSSEIRLAIEDFPPGWAFVAEMPARKAVRNRKRRNMHRFISSVLRGARINVHPKINAVVIYEILISGGAMRILLNEREGKGPPSR
jgi:hypothetical protein